MYETDHSHSPFDHAGLIANVAAGARQFVEAKERGLDLEHAIVHALRYVVLSPFKNVRSDPTQSGRTETLPNIMPESISVALRFASAAGTGADSAMMISSSLAWLAPASRVRFPRTLPGERGEPPRGDMRIAPSSTSVASVSAEPFEPSVCGRSASSSSSSLDMTRASLASSSSGVTAGFSAYSRLKKRSPRCLTTECW
jgi:hypothetical protein